MYFGAQKFSKLSVCSSLYLSSLRYLVCKNVLYTIAISCVHLMDCEDNNVNLSVLKYQNNVILGRILSLEPEYFSWREHVKKKKQNNNDVCAQH